MNQTSDDETTPLRVSEAPKPRKKNCCGVLREEFRWRSFGFDFPNADVFYRSQWPLPRLVFVIFRVCLAVYTGVICVLTITYFPRNNPERPWILWLTNWSYLLLTLHEVCAAAIALVHSTDRTTGFCCREIEDGTRKGDEDQNGGTDTRVAERRTDYQSPVPCYAKLDWLLFSVVAPGAVMVTAIVVLFTPLGKTTAKGLNNHILNGVVVLLEFCLTALPVRLFHFVYFTLYLTSYFLVSYIFWSFDHTANVTYPGFIDWNYPESTAMNWVVMALIMPIIMQIVLFFVYRLRVFIFTKIYGDEESRYEKIYD